MPGLAPIARAEEAASPVRPEGMSEGRHVDGVRILGMDNYAADRIGVAESGELPRLSGINGFVNAIAHHDVAADTGFAGANIDQVRIPRSVAFGRRYRRGAIRSEPDLC